MDLRETINQNRHKFLKLDQVIGVGRGFKEVSGERTEMQSIQFLVRKKLPAEQVRQRDLVPEKINGYLTDVIEVGRVRALDVRTEHIRPAQPGVSVGHYLISAGTFGAVVFDRSTGKPLILSNNHILANSSTSSYERAEIGDPILQPGPYDGGKMEEDVIAYLERYVPLQMKMTEQVGIFGRGFTNLLNLVLKLLFPSRQGVPRYQFKLVRRSVENIVDCAVAAPVSPSLIDGKVLEIGRVKGVRRPEVGEILQKSGRTSGLTQGAVRTLDATLTVEMGNGEEAVFADQILVDLISQGGDSGSLVLDKKRNACGLLFAGSDTVTVCNPIDAVLEALGVRF